MTDDHGTDPLRVREPVQVYLDPDDQDRLERLRQRLGTSKSEVLRKGLASLEHELTDPDSHPAMRIVGIGASECADPGSGTDAARNHDEVLADTEERSWSPPGDPET